MHLSYQFKHITVSFTNRTNWRKSGRIIFVRADTNSCIKEAKKFFALGDAFARENTEVIGISQNRLLKLANLGLTHNLTCLLGADHETDLCEQFGIWVKKSVYGKVSWASIGRVSSLISIEKNNKYLAQSKGRWPGPRSSVLGKSPEARTGSSCLDLKI